MKLVSENTIYYYRNLVHYCEEILDPIFHIFSSVVPLRLKPIAKSSKTVVIVSFFFIFQVVAVDTFAAN